MQKVLWALISFILFSLFAASISHASELTDDQVRKILIRDSLAKHSGCVPALTTPTARAANAASAVRIQNLAAMHRFVIHRM